VKMNVIDADGVWLVNRSEFRMVDGETGVIYEPNVPTQVRDSKWRKAREDVIALVKNPAKDKVVPVVPEQLPKDLPGQRVGAPATK